MNNNMNNNTLDYYNVLGIDKKATPKEIREAYKKKAREYHPDRNKNCEKSTKKFKELVQSYKVLSDNTLRKQYDYGLYDQSSNFSFSQDDMSKIFQDMMSDFAFDVNTKYGVNFKIYSGDKKELQKGKNIEYNLSVNLEDVYNKVTKKLKITRKKNLNGIYQNDINEFDIQLYKRELIFEKEGHEIKNEESIPGDVFINLFDKPDPNYKRINENDLLFTMNISIMDLYKDKIYEIPLFNGELHKLNIKKETLLESRFIEIENLGLPNIFNGEERGKLIIYFNIILKCLDHSQIKKLESVFEPIKDDQFSHNSDFITTNLLDIISDE